MIQQRGASFVVRLSIEGKVVWGGSYSTRSEAEAARDQIHAARLRGEPLPEFPRKIKVRTCTRCGELGHDLRKCTGLPLPPKPSPYPPRPAPTPWTKEEKSAAMKAGWARRKAELAAKAAGEPPAPPPAPKASRKGTPEYRAAVAAGMRRVWAERRALNAGGAVAPRIGRAPRVPRPAPPPRARAKLPPRCVRCFRVGHVEAECPTAARPSAERAKQEVFTEPSPVFTKEGTAFTDDDDGTDLTDLVDVPEPYAPAPAQVETAGPALVTPPPPIELPRAPVHLALVDDDPIEDSYPEGIERPKTRGDCKGQARPCPFVTCQHHLYRIAVLQAQDRSAHAGKEPWQLPETCTLDVADKGGMTLEEVGQILGVTRERVRQLEERGLERAARNARRRKMDFEEIADRSGGAAEDFAPYTHARGRP